MMWGMGWGRCELVGILITGAIGLRVGVPRPVVNTQTLAPEPTWAVTDSTSLPGVHNRFNPGSVAYSGKSSTSVTGDVPPFLAAPADFIPSVINPSRIFPGEGFRSKPEPPAWARPL